MPDGALVTPAPMDGDARAPRMVAPPGRSSTPVSPGETDVEFCASKRTGGPESRVAPGFRAELQDPAHKVGADRRGSPHMGAHPTQTSRSAPPNPAIPPQQPDMGAHPPRMSGSCGPAAPPAHAPESTPRIA